MSCKYLRLAATLRDTILAHQFDFQYKLPTEAELCKTYQVSRQTVRQALLLLEQENLIIKRQGSGSYPVISGFSSHSKQAALLLPDSYSYLNPTILKESQTLFNDYGYSVQVFITESLYEQERKILKHLLTKNISSIFVVGIQTAMPNPNHIFYKSLINRGAKLIFLGPAYRELSYIPSFSIDNYKAAFSLTEYLINQHHQKIAGIFNEKDFASHQKYTGFCDAILQNNLPLPDSSIYWENIIFSAYDEAQINQNAFPESFLQYIKENCTAVLCHNDESAYRFMKSCLRIGIKIPQDLSIVSFDNSYLSSLCQPALTSVSPAKSPWIQGVSYLLGLSNQCTIPYQIVHKNSDLKL